MILGIGCLAYSLIWDWDLVRSNKGIHILQIYIDLGLKSCIHINLRLRSCEIKQSDGENGVCFGLSHNLKTTVTPFTKMNVGHKEQVKCSWTSTLKIKFKFKLSFPQTTKKEGAGKLEIEDEQLVDRWDFLNLYILASSYFRNSISPFLLFFQGCLCQIFR